MSFNIVTFGVTTALTASFTNADLVTYDIVWQGVNAGTSAVGSVTIDTLLAPSGPLSPYEIGSVFTDFSITIIQGDSEFTSTSASGLITGITYGTSVPPESIDFESELISQGVQGFSVIGVYFYDIGEGEFVDQIGSNIFSTVSVTPVPTPGALAFLGLGGLVGARRKR